MIWKLNTVEPRLYPSRYYLLYEYGFKNRYTYVQFLNTVLNRLLSVVILIDDMPFLNLWFFYSIGHLKVFSTLTYFKFLTLGLIIHK